MWEKQYNVDWASRDRDSYILPAYRGGWTQHTEPNKCTNRLFWGLTLRIQRSVVMAIQDFAHWETGRQWEVRKNCNDPGLDRMAMYGKLVQLVRLSQTSWKWWNPSPEVFKARILQGAGTWCPRAQGWASELGSRKPEERSALREAASGKSSSISCIHCFFKLRALMAVESLCTRPDQMCCYESDTADAGICRSWLSIRYLDFFSSLQRMSCVASAILQFPGRAELGDSKWGAIFGLVLLDTFDFGTWFKPFFFGKDLDSAKWSLLAAADDRFRDFGLAEFQNLFI